LSRYQLRLIFIVFSFLQILTPIVFGTAEPD